MAVKFIFPFVRTSSFLQVAEDRDYYRNLYHQLVREQMRQSTEVLNSALRRHGYAQVGESGERERQAAVEAARPIWSPLDRNLYESWLAERMTQFNMSRTEAETRYAEEFGKDALPTQVLI